MSNIKMRNINRKYQTYPCASIHRNALAQQFGNISNLDLFNVSFSSRHFVQRFTKLDTLLGHTGCVNTVAWNTNGTLLLSGSDDYMLNIYDVDSWKMLHSVQSGHHANIFSAKFLPCTSDMKIVSCSGDGMLQYNELSTTYGGNYFNCHSGTTYEVVVTPGDPNTFFSCGEDGTVRLFDLRTKTKCHCTECADDILIDTRHGVTSISINPVIPFHLAVGCKDSFLYLFDYRTLSTSESGRSVYNRSDGNMTGLFCKFKPKKLRRDASCRITSVQYSNDGKNVLTSYCADYVYAFSVDKKNARCMDSSGQVNRESEPEPKDASGSGSDDSVLPPVKRLRLRGDWSDTGPQAGPDSTGESVTENNLMQRMSVLFSAFLEDVVGSHSAGQETSEVHQSDEGGEGVEVLEGVPGIGTTEVIVESEENDNIGSNTVVGTALEDEGGHCEENLRGHSDIEDIGGHEISQVSELVEVDAVVDKSEEKEVSPYPEDLCRDTSDKEHERTPSQIEDCPVAEDCNETLNHLFTNHDRSGAGSSGSCDAGKGRNEEKDNARIENTVSGNVETGQIQNKGICSDSLPRQNVVSISQLDSTGIGVESSIPREVVESSQGFSQMFNESNDEIDAKNRHEAAVKIQKFLRQSKTKMSTSQAKCTDMSSIFTPLSYSVFKGHRNARTMIKEANFWGDDYILSGSDCGRIFIWDRHTGQLVMLLQGDSRVVNCVQPHPFDPILASSGIDHDIKIWAPLALEGPDLSEAGAIMERNEQMLEKSCDTITVPASFVFRMLATFRSRRRQTDDNGISDDENLGDNEDED